MKNELNVYIISLKHSKRVKKLKAKLKKSKIKFKIIQGVDGNNLFKNGKLNKITDEKKILYNVGRKMSPSEIGAAASHLKIYQYVVKNRLSQAIIMEDDAFPSSRMKEWIKKKISAKNNEILSFYAYPSGHIEKKHYRNSIKNVKIHKSKTHLFNSSCYQINYYTCKKILNITKKKVIALPDWPFNSFENKIYHSVTIPFLSLIHDEGHSNLRKSRNTIFREDKIYKIKNLIPKKTISFFSFFYYFFFIEYFFSKRKKNFYYYLDHYFIKKLYILINLIGNFHIDQRKAYWNYKFYSKDLHKIAKNILIK